MTDIILSMLAHIAANIALGMLIGITIFKMLPIILVMPRYIRARGPSFIAIGLEMVTLIFGLGVALTWEAIGHFIPMPAILLSWAQIALMLPLLFFSLAWLGTPKAEGRYFGELMKLLAVHIGVLALAIHGVII